MSMSMNMQVDYTCINICDKHVHEIRSTCSIKKLHVNIIRYAACLYNQLTC